jgi:hypothetical protein
MKNIAIFLGDFFWSSVPYDGIRLLKELQKDQNFRVDLLMFENDIRLNKKFSGNEKYYFETEIFKLEKNLKTIKNWNEFFIASGDYSLILAPTHIAPKTRYPHGIKANKKCPIAAWDIGGTDIITNATQFADFYFVKGPIWKKWLSLEKNINEKNVWTTGSPHYENYYIKNYSHNEKSEFVKKYDLKETKSILVCPSNPSSHTQQFEQNMDELKKLIKLSKEMKANVLLKTYPHDYVFHEKEQQYTGIYKRSYKNKPQYEFLIQKFPELIVLQSQDHYEAVMFCDALFNMSGSSISWETHFSNAKSYSMNYKDKPYYEMVSYLKHAKLPDNLYNEHIENINDLHLKGKNKNEDNEYIVSLDSCKEIKNAVIHLMKEEFQ